MNALKIALVHEYLTNFAGSEQVLLALHEMFPRSPIYTAMYYPDKVPQFVGADVRTSFLQKFPPVKEKVYIPLMPLAVEGYDLSAYDLVISDSHIAAKGVITKPETLHICYCHTPIRYAWSPEIDPRSSGSLLRRFAAHYLRVWDVYAAERVDHFIANSSYIAQRIEKYYRVDSAVIHPPVDLSRLKIATLEVGDYYVYASRLIDYKRPDIVIDAFNKSGEKLIVLGRGPMLKQLQAEAGGNITFISHFVSYQKMSELFSAAKAMIFSAEEDFGIVMVEAMACGRPVIAYKAGGATDIVVPGKTGEFFTAQSAPAINEAIATFDPMAYDRDAIRSHALRFDREEFKKKMTVFIKQKIEERI